MTTRLITIAFSHYCEKARWALERAGVPFDEDIHLPGFHYRAVKRAGGDKTVPVLVSDGQTVRDSTDIVAWADTHRPGSLIPVTAAGDALQLEDELDNHFGPATRRWAYYHLLPNRAADPYVVKGAPKWQATAFKVTRPIVVAMLRRGLKIDDAGVARSRDKIEQTFARIDALLADGRRYLTGDRFTVADLTFAALAAPILLPPEHPKMQLPLELFSATARDDIARWRDGPAGRFGLQLYATERAR
jgi:glutathione S-transferase